MIVARGICTNCKMCLSKLQNVFVHIAKCICLNCKMYLSKLQDCICEDGELVSSATSLALAVRCTIYAMGTIHQHLILFFLQKLQNAICNFSFLSSDWPNLYGHMDGRPELIMKYQPNDLFILSLVSSTCLALYSYFFERLHDAICWGQQEIYSHTFHQIGWPELNHYIRAGK